MKAAVARLQRRNWVLENLPFQPEFPGDRVWNIGAQLAYEPTKEDRPMVHPHWDMIFQHLGKGLDEAVAADPWCQANGVRNGATYLLYWAASLFQRPHQKLPYLFLFGPQNAGKRTSAQRSWAVDVEGARRSEERPIVALQRRTRRRDPGLHRRGQLERQERGRLPHASRTSLPTTRFGSTPSTSIPTSQFRTCTSFR